LEAQGVRTLVGTETVFDREYVVEYQIIFSESAPDTFEAWFRYRQDEWGLFAADVPSTQPPASQGPDAPAPRQATEWFRPWLDGLPNTNRHGSPHLAPVLSEHLRQGRLLRNLSPSVLNVHTGSPDNEVKLLAYPLDIDTRWTARAQPQITTAVVEALETIELAAGTMDAYRIRLESAALDPDDFVLWWYGPCGRLRTLTHIETIAVDSSTGESVLIVTEEIEELVGPGVTPTNSTAHSDAVRHQAIPSPGIRQRFP
jgi:hypothetical protein